LDLYKDPKKAVAEEQRLCGVISKLMVHSYGVQTQKNNSGCNKDLEKRKKAFVKMPTKSI
jgi:hypothetical protein